MRISLQIKRIHEELIRPLRLPSPLRAEAEEDDVAFAILDIQRRRFAFNFRRADEVAARERITINIPG